ncbi:MAG: cation transporter [Bacteroidales bacterium]|nr:cation transporter [Bacteroidales bacterium]
MEELHKHEAQCGHNHAEHSHEHNHTHSHGHHHHHHGNINADSLNKAFIWGIVLNALFVVVEFLIGFFAGSVGLISDAGHNLSDVASLILAMLAFRLAKIHTNNNYTYGYKKMTIHVSLINAVILIIAVAFIIWESIHKLFAAEVVEGKMISITAAVGVLVNGVTAWLFMKDKEKDLNVKGAYLHMAADALVSIGVVVSGIIIMLTGMYWIDGVIGLVVAAIIIYSTFDLLHDSLRLALDGVPEGISVDKIVEGMKNIANVEDIHHIHIWAISTTENALTSHVFIKDINRLEETKSQIKDYLQHNNIAHSTLEFEVKGTHCSGKNCGC